MVAVVEAATTAGTQVGEFDQPLDEEPNHGWTIADMKKDWSRVFP